MKTFVLASVALLAFAAVNADTVDAGRPHHHHKEHGKKSSRHLHRHKEHHHDHRHMKFQEVDVVGNNQECPRGGSVVLCSSPSYECQDAKGSGSKQGMQTCLPRDTSFLDSIDDKTTGPWNQCTVGTDSDLPTKCLFGFQCICDDLALKECYCMPPDAFRMSRGTPDSCKTSDGQVGCDAGKYCRTKGSKQECADAPYLPGLPLYAQCDGDYNSPCQDGLKCQKYSDAFSMCVKA
ncbi:hypothetical protein FI667_g3260, partial [Globisporangium splendens]